MTADFSPAQETLRLSKLQDYNILDTPAESAYDDIVELAAHICEAPTALISLIDAERQWFKAKVGLEATESPRDVAFCALTIQQDDVLIVEDTHQSALFRNNPLVTEAPYIRFYAGAPLITPDGYAVGSLCVIDYEPRRINEHQKQALKILSRQVVAQMELSRQSKKLRAINTSLESRIAERTAGLTAALQKLLITQNKLRKRETALQHSALHDPLTGLPNRSYFSQRLAQAIQLTSRKPNHLYAVLFIDIDNFAQVNAALGSERGDRILKQVASRTKLMLRKSDLVARLGGDKFAVLLDDIPNQEQAIIAVERIQAQLKLPFNSGDDSVFISTSIGITFGTQGYRQPETALRDANIAMQQAKQQTKQRVEKFLDAQLKQQKRREPGNKALGNKTLGNKTLGSLKSPILIQEDAVPVAQQFVVFDTTLSKGTQHRLALEDELRQAVLCDQFELYYQPIFALSNAAQATANQATANQPNAKQSDANQAKYRATQISASKPALKPDPKSALIGFEGLLRWHHPDRGLLDAKAFIDVAEEIGIVRQICKQTIQSACQNLKEWRDRFNQPNLKLHINLSLTEIQWPELMTHWQRALTEYQLPPGTCRIEISEQLLLSSDPTIRKALQQLNALGLDLCIDDFGRGHSSLSRLHQLSITAVKIDQTFVEKLDEASSTDIIKTITDLGHSADMEVIAEGIETDYQRATLTRLGCQIGQGFWLSEPLSAQAVESTF